MKSLRSARKVSIIALVLSAALALGTAPAPAEESGDNPPPIRATLGRDAPRAEAPPADAPRPNEAKGGRDAGRPAAPKPDGERVSGRAGSGTLAKIKLRIDRLTRLKNLTVEKGDKDLVEFVDGMLREEITKYDKLSKSIEQRLQKAEGPKPDGKKGAANELPRAEGERRPEGQAVPPRGEGEVRNPADPAPPPAGNLRPGGDAQPESKSK